MSDVLNAAVEALTAKMADADFSNTAKFAIEGEGSIVIDGAGVRIGDDETDVTLSADIETFQSMLEGELDPTSAFMTGRLSIDGDMGAAMQLGGALS
ncbi:MAG: SCP2 sterol-binding domain-containing protein [Paracoccaceae bacterium]|jgi:putative sterol carrier protein|nr:SCP2 sterol-binding domain-containing protein [Paracoccaceae bacterium]MDP7185599.1 SCP2 sterol-binding domain-containing protein [Paracoccaceae bacterium]